MDNKGYSNQDDVGVREWCGDGVRRGTCSLKFRFELLLLLLEKRFDALPPLLPNPIPVEGDDAEFEFDEEMVLLVLVVWTLLLLLLMVS